MSPLKNIVKYGKKAVSTFLVANAIYIVGFLIGVNTLSMTVSPRIESPSQLESILKREREKLGMQDNISIQVNLKDGPFNGNSGKTGEDEYKIVLTGRSRNISNLRHELYHIKDGHCDARKCRWV